MQTIVTSKPPTSKNQVYMYVRCQLDWLGSNMDKELSVY